MSKQHASVPIVVLSTKGEVHRANLPLNQEGEVTMEAMQKYVKKKDVPERIGMYEQGTSRVYTVFGYTKGKKGTENKTELPEPYSEVTLYGEILILCSPNPAWARPIPLTIDAWTAFYQHALHGEDNEDEEDEDEDEEAEEDEEEEEEEEEEPVEDDANEEEDEEDETQEEEEEEEADVEIEDEPALPIKKRRGMVANKTDVAALKEEISIHSTAESQPLRLKCIEGFAFLYDLGFTKEDITAFEQSLFEVAHLTAQQQYIPRNWKSIEFGEIYRQTVRMLLSNLHPCSPVKNHRLMARVKEGEFTLDSIPFMTSYEMFPENWFSLKDKMLQREQKILEGNKSRATDQFKCRRCQKRECTYYELQTRSADEPMTIFITCLNCGKEWRQGG